MNEVRTDRRDLNNWSLEDFDPCPIVGITERDLALLDDHTFQELWHWLGIAVRQRCQYKASPWRKLKDEVRYAANTQGREE